MNPSQTNSGVGTQNKYGVAMNTPFTGTQIPSMLPGMASTNPATNVASPAVVSNQGAINKVKDMTNAVNQMAQSRGMTSDGTTTKYADGTIAQDNYQEPTLPQGATPIYGSVNGVGNRIVGYQTPNLNGGGLGTPTYFDSNSSTPKVTPEEQQYQDLLASMKASTDATTASTIASIQQKSALLRQQQEQINAAQTAGTQNALLMGGVTGQGSSSQYAPISSQNIIAAQMSYGVQKLAQLDAQEQDLINSAKAAGETKNFQLMEKQLSHIDEIRKEKIAQAKTLNDKIAEQNAKAREKMIQATRDNALADLLSQGVTDPKELIDLLNANGGDFTLKEITDGLKNISDAVGIETSKLPAKTKEFFAFKEKGELPASILALPTESEQLNAYLRNQAIASKIYAPTKGKAPTTYKSGGLVYTPTDFAEDSKALEASRGADSYVNSEIYANLYKAWVANKGLLKDFIIKFPPKNYVNPNDTSVPVFLRPAVSKAKSTVDQL